MPSSDCFSLQIALSSVNIETIRIRYIEIKLYRNSIYRNYSPSLANLDVDVANFRLLEMKTKKAVAHGELCRDIPFERKYSGILANELFASRISKCLPETFNFVHFQT